ncbi:ribonuclease P protein component [Chryseobacterium sp. GMJ5]|uniref:Ribonuclease P protein component n=1 Tax=Chryseobacterium gilvum TaxID=2976534 RepID=A0ABT2W1S8_9FLAO|nr:ribonuclease P protein component [Chryseobacterium gilvum]MCU7614660.1 ribonuclease P protein component [Chryseobacterium gilvum]
MQNFKYPAEEKLKKKNEITLLFEKGKWKNFENLRIIVLKNHPEILTDHVKIGVSVSKRYFKKAVHRNRIKRLLRECYRLHKDLFKEAFGEKTIAMLFWVSPELPQKFQQVEEQFIKLCQTQKKS